MKRGLFRKVFFTLDHSLPNDGRVRYMYEGDRPFSQKRRIEPGSLEENAIIAEIRKELEEHVGVSATADAIHTGNANLEGQWRYVASFIITASRERPIKARTADA